MALFDIKNLSFTYPDESIPALYDVSLSIEQGEFITLLGATGSGKSTLLRMLKPELSVIGARSGSICFDGADIEKLSTVDSALKIGYVAQNPEEQIVCDKVWQELAFTLENLGVNQSLTAQRVAETASFFGISSWYDLPTTTLSGGQKQLLNLASVMTADPQVLVLDEPTSQLDPIAASRFIDTLRRLNLQTGVTVIICEHRAEELFPVSDRVVLLEKGRIIVNGTPKKVAESLDKDSKYHTYLPTAARIFSAVGDKGEIPLSIREGQKYIAPKNNAVKALPKNTAENSTKNKAFALELQKVYFRYEKHGKDILSDLSLTVFDGEIFALLGENGAGKSTAVAVAAGLRKPYSGTVSLFGKRLKDYKNGTLYMGNLSLLPQDAESVFIYETVGEELFGCEEVLAAFPYDLSHLFSRHPYDISGGERQLVALCKALSTGPKVIIMDEPSKGLDPLSKLRLKEVILSLKKRGVTVVIVSHDIEFAAECADRCAMFSQGGIAAVGDTDSFMSGNRFYTTAASRITHRRYEGAFTAEKAVELIRLNTGDSNADDKK